MARGHAARFALFSAAIAAFAAAGTAPAQTPEEPAPPPDPWLADKEPLLSGPRLDDQAAEKSLVRFDFSGGLRRLDRTPEEAALDALNLPFRVRNQADTIVRARFSALDEIVRDNLDLLVELANARQAGNKPEAAELVGRLAEKMEPLREEAFRKGRLRDEIAAVLPENDRREFHRLIDDYWRALVKDEMQQAEARKEKLTLAQARLRVTTAALGQEVRRSYERQFKPREKQFEELLVALNLTPEQEGKARTQVLDFVQRTKGKPSPRESFDLTMKILPLLTREQRVTLARMLLGVSPMEPNAEAGGPGAAAAGK